MRSVCENALNAHRTSFPAIKEVAQLAGHSSPAMLKKYIKAENLKVVEKLTDKYDYFK